MSRAPDRRRTLLGLAAAPFAAACNRGRAVDAIDHGEPLSQILHVVRATPSVDGAGATLARVFPGPALRHLDPFVMLDDFDVAQPAGFPDHPHRGFEAFTYMIEGAFEHRDNLGNESRVVAGGIQRFNSGRGARHSEMPGTAGRNRGLQLWVNLPRRLKTMAPEYEEKQAAALPVVDGRRTIVGKGSPVALKTAVDYLDVALPAGGRFQRDVELGWNTFLYVLQGAVAIGARVLSRGEGAVLGGGRLAVASTEAARFAFLSGRPHGEPIVQRGPFVD